MSNVTSVSGTTCVDREDCKFVWTIKNSKFLMSTNECLESPIFSAECGEEFYFRLIYDDKRNRVLYLCCPNIKNQFKCICEVSVIDLRQNRSSIINRKIMFETSKEEISLKLIPAPSSDNYFPDCNDAIVKCALTLSSGVKRSFIESESRVDKSKELAPKLDFNWIFLNENLSDIKLRTSCGKEIPAHKVVLANASPVFKAMFSHDMMENQSQSVDMMDVKYEAAVEMLRYIYTGSVEAQEFSLTSELLAAAEKYQLEGLKNTCDLKLASNLSTENTVKALAFADTYNAKYLKKRAISLFNRSMCEPLDYNKISHMLLSKEQPALE
ncbi:BTB/POZ domain-containing protein At4g08455-like [Trichogramma pretiosum]|uniref:BTB/POZ domain-containing protein At4g08455-like n=1 Tax=Trichogramma pretiosum TaxID=7493 RepID=UPI000C71C997|nr:BTB/POZ domain-containing protein At4g08455-like [Trichogramma pretiosum]